ncbi:GIN domain-containing protein [Croceitalea sp. MTPC5]|uniref:GIN domain-containing protein n=1 Tax=Croceitalea sp. MTPC5 TaxID=3056565 RepID=UPI0030CE73E4
MKKSNSILIVAFAVLALFFLAFQLTFHTYVKKGEASGIGTYVSIERSLTSFTKLKVRDEVMVHYTQDTLTQLKVEAPKHLLDSLKTNVENNELTITIGEARVGNDSILLYINNHQLKTLEIGTEAYFESMDTLLGKALQLTVQDKGIAKLNLSYDSIHCRIAPDSEVVFKGTLKNIDFSNLE